MIYKNWIEDWLNLYVKPSSKKRTFERYCQTCSLHVIPKLGEYKVEEITVSVLQKFIIDLLTNGNHRTGKGLSTNFVNTIISVVQSSLKTAQLVGVTQIYHANNIKRPKTEEKRVNCFTLQEQKRIEQYVLNNKKTKLLGIVLCLYTGLRIGELLALTWDDIDFEKRI